MKGTYDEISKRVNEEISKLGKSGTFADLAKIDKNRDYPEEQVGKWVGSQITMRLRMRTED